MLASYPSEYRQPQHASYLHWKEWAQRRKRAVGNMICGATNLKGPYLFLTDWVIGRSQRLPRARLRSAACVVTSRDRDTVDITTTLVDKWRYFFLMMKN